MEKLEYKIEKDLAKVRLDKAISEKDKNLSRARIQKLLEDGKILVNGVRQKASYKVNEGDLIEIEKVEPKEVNIKPEEIPLDIIYEDDDILIVNKQKGLVVHPRKWKSRWNFG